MEQRMCVELPGGKTHYLIADVNERFPYGRPLCAPFAVKETDMILPPNEVLRSNFCKICFRKANTWTQR